MQDFARHYGCSVLPARPRLPQDKAKVESAVQVVERWILMRLRHQRFASVDDVNEAIEPLLAQLNTKPFQKLPGSRASAFAELDAPALQAVSESFSASFILGGQIGKERPRLFNVYAAGNAQCALSDLTEEFTFGYTPFISYLMGRTPFVDPDEYLKDSPFYGSKDIKTPTLLFQGTNDFLPVPLMTNIHDQLEANGTEVTFLRVEGEGHGFGSPDSQAYAGQLQLEFFRKHLLRELPDLPEPPHGGRIFLPAVIRNHDASIPPTN